MENSVDKLYEKLVEYEIAEEILDSIDELDDLIGENNYNKKKIIEIENKFSNETKFLLELGNSEQIGFEKNYEDSDMQVLINLRNRLYYIAVLKILKERGIEIPKDFMKKDFNELLELIEN